MKERIRLIILTLMLGSIIILKLFGFISTVIIPTLSMASVLYFVILFYSMLGHEKKFFDILDILFLILIILLVTITLHYLGGYESVFVYFYIIPILYASIVFTFTVSLGITTLAAFCYVILILMESCGILLHINVFNFAFKYNFSWIPIISNVFLFYLTSLYCSLMSNVIKSQENIISDTNRKLIQTARMAAIGQMASGIAHQMNNPLVGVLNLSQLLLKKIKQDNEYYPLIQSIVQAAHECKSITDELLKLSRTPRFEFREVCINDVIEEAIKIVKPQSTAKNIKIDYQISLKLPAIKADPEQLKQALVNIIVNAIHAVDENAGYIQIQSGKINNKIYISITDNGSGISEKDLEYIFEPYFTTKRETGGTGLGLSIAYKIIEEHKGNIAVKSSTINDKTEKRGTRIIIEFSVS